MENSLRNRESLLFLLEAIESVTNGCCTASGAPGPKPPAGCAVHVSRWLDDLRANGPERTKAAALLAGRSCPRGGKVATRRTETVPTMSGTAGSTQPRKCAASLYPVFSVPCGSVDALGTPTVSARGIDRCPGMARWRCMCRCILTGSTTTEFPLGRASCLGRLCSANGKKRRGCSSFCVLDRRWRRFRHSAWLSCFVCSHHTAAFRIAGSRQSRSESHSCLLVMMECTHTHTNTKGRRSAGGCNALSYSIRRSSS